MSLQTELLGVSEIIDTLEKVKKDPPHLFFSGPYGSGKTTLVNDFLRNYFSGHGIKYDDPNWCLQIRSDQDRGIHRIRETITEFVRRVSLIPGVCRWIFIDDADSLPTLSQQALRRPMETHYHTTRFVFCSRHINDLIPALRSRCLHIECNPFTALDAWPYYEDIYDLPKDNNIKAMILAKCATIDQLKMYGPIWRNLEERTASSKITIYPDRDPFYIETIYAILKDDKKKLLDCTHELYSRGHSFEDCLSILSERSQQLLCLTPDQFETLQTFFIQGWIYSTQGRTGFLDLVDLFLTRRWQTISSAIKKEKDV